MEFEDSRNALFVEPNAYIQNFNGQERKNNETKKIVFQEPYECLPNHYLNNNFTKHGCECITKHGNNAHDKQDCNCNNKHKNENQCDNNCCDKNNNHNDKKNGFFGFDLKKLMPLLSLLGNGGNSGLGQIASLLNNSESDLKNSNPMNLISSLMSNKDAMSGILNLFKGGGLNFSGKSKPSKKEIRTTDFQIKNYTRVEWF